MSDLKKVVFDFYKKNSRSNLPWRPPTLNIRKDGSIDPYKVLVSEIMLQQTQVDRVISKFNSWMKRFPNVESLSKASLSEVLEEWQGLGYNRRGLNLHKTAQVVVDEHKGKIPRDREELKRLPGIGDYTSGAVMAFAFNKPVVFIETNIRSVFLHEFFKDHGMVHDSELFPLIEKTLDADNPRDWYYALMDYGSYIKKEFGNPNKKSRHYTKQSRFEGSNREIRSKILKYILKNGSVSEHVLLRDITSEKWDVQKNLEKMMEEGLIKKEKNLYTVAH